MKPHRQSVMKKFWSPVWVFLFQLSGGGGASQTQTFCRRFLRLFSITCWFFRSSLQTLGVELLVVGLNEAIQTVFKLTVFLWPEFNQALANNQVPFTCWHTHFIGGLRSTLVLPQVFQRCTKIRKSLDFVFSISSHGEHLVSKQSTNKGRSWLCVTHRSTRNLFSLNDF